jgi:hypothetical protein
LIVIGLLQPNHLLEYNVQYAIASGQATNLMMFFRPPDLIMEREALCCWRSPKPQDSVWRGV